LRIMIILLIKKVRMSIYSYKNLVVG